MASEPLLEISGLTKRFGGLVAINDVSFAVAAGAVHAVIGPNGAGKTSIFNCITSFVSPTAGTIAMDGERIDGLAPHRIATHGIARTYQNVRLFPDLTARDNVLVGRHRKVKAAVWEVVARTPRFRREEAELLAAADELLSFVGVPHQRDRIARNLPYGDQRRLEIARALATDPRLLLLDEPAAGMNPAEAQGLVALIERIRTERGVTVLMIEHHMRVVMTISDRITVLDRGAVLAEGTPAEIHADERVVAAYLGKRAEPVTKAAVA